MVSHYRSQLSTVGLGAQLMVEATLLLRPLWAPFLCHISYHIISYIIPYHTIPYHGPRHTIYYTMYHTVNHTTYHTVYHTTYHTKYHTMYHSNCIGLVNKPHMCILDSMAQSVICQPIIQSDGKLAGRPEFDCWLNKRQCLMYGII